MVRARADQAKYIRTTEDARKILVEIMRDGRERTTQELTAHPKMKHLGMSVKAVGTLLDYMVKEGRMVKDVIANPNIRIWRME